MSRFDGAPPGAQGNMPSDPTLDVVLQAVRRRYDDMVLEPAKAERALLRKAFPQKRRWPVWAFGGSAIAVSAMLLFFVFQGAWLSRPLMVTVLNASIGEGGYLHRSPEDKGVVQAEFSDGSHFRWLKGSRGRIRATTPKGATLAVEDGTLEAIVKPLPAAAWSVEAGPFVVQVTGTAFHVTWSGSDEKFLLDLHHGKVTITGPLVGQVHVVAGQKVSVSLREGIVSWANPTTAPPHSPLPAQPSPEVAPSLPTPVTSPMPRRTAPAQKRPTPDSWSTMVSRGDFAQVIADAEARGIEKSLNTADRVGLAALADAARYARRFDIVEPALKRAIQRFPRSIEAEHAPFLLGRIYDEAARWPEAASWYSRYLSGSPNGSYAAEALGRKMIVLSRLNTPKDTAAAQALAKAYLGRFPAGPYAQAARKLLDLR